MSDDPRRFAETLGSGEEVHAHWGGRASDVHEKCRKEIERLRADRDRWHKIANELHLWLMPDFEDDEVGEAGVYAMQMYEQAVRGE